MNGIWKTNLLGVWMLAAAVGPVEGQVARPSSITETVFALAGGGEMRYAISVPAGSDASSADPRPLVLALHPGGQSPYYGSWFMQALVEPALRGWGAVIVAPDVIPGRSWSSPESERAVLALLDDVKARYSVDPDRMLVTGFSAGGAGVWYLASRNPDRFTGAIAVASRPREDDREAFASIPLGLVHSPDDEVVPYEPVEEVALMLAERGYRVRLLSVAGFSHYETSSYVGPLRAVGQWIEEQWRVEAAGGR